MYYLLLDRWDTCNRICSSQESLEEHKFTCRPTIIDDTAVIMMTEAEIHDDKVFLVSRKEITLRKRKKVDYGCSSPPEISKETLDSDNKPYKCKFCENTFKTEQNMKTHMYTHTGEKPYKCPHCEFKCNSGHSLKRHIRTHTGEKPYLCQYCDKRFNQMQHLKRHIATHTGEKLFKCHECE